MADFKLVTEDELCEMSPAEFSDYMEKAAQLDGNCWTCNKVIRLHPLATVDENGRCKTCCSEECMNKRLELLGLSPGKALVDMTAEELAEVNRNWEEARAKARRWNNVAKA